MSQAWSDAALTALAALEADPTAAAAADVGAVLAAVEAMRGAEADLPEDAPAVRSSRALGLATADAWSPETVSRLVALTQGAPDEASRRAWSDAARNVLVRGDGRWPDAAEVFVASGDGDAIARLMVALKLGGPLLEWVGGQLSEDPWKGYKPAEIHHDHLLGHLPDPRAEALLERVYTKADWMQRRVLLHGVRRPEDAAAVPVLVRVAAGADATTRVEVARAVGRIGDAAAEPFLTQLIERGHPAEMSAAQEALTAVRQRAGASPAARGGLDLVGEGGELSVAGPSGALSLHQRVKAAMDLPALPGTRGPGAAPDWARVGAPPRPVPGRLKAMHVLTSGGLLWLVIGVGLTALWSPPETGLTGGSYAAIALWLAVFVAPGVHFLRRALQELKQLGTWDLTLAQVVSFFQVTRGAQRSRHFDGRCKLALLDRTGVRKELTVEGTSGSMGARPGDVVPVLVRSQDAVPLSRFRADLGVDETGRLSARLSSHWRRLAIVAVVVTIVVTLHVQSVS